MSHVDEGALHAYLDGALDEYPTVEAERIRQHLDACAECAQRLEAERGIRSEAHDVLALVDPKVELPSLEELRAYVKRTRPERPAATVRMMRMGWAASVVLAVGAGWMARGGLDQAVTLERAGVETASEAASSPRPMLDAVEAEEADVLNSAVEAALPTRPAERLAVVQVGSSDMDREDRSGVSGAVIATTAKARDERARAVGELLGAGGGAAAPASVAALEAFRQEMTAVPPAEPAAASLDEQLRGRETADVAAAPPIAGADLVANAEPDAAAEPLADAERPAERRLAESLVPLTSAMQSGRGSMFVVPPDDDRFNDEPGLTVPGFDVVSITNLGEGTTPEGVVVVQRLEGDAVLEIYHLDPGVDPEVLPPLGMDVNEVRFEGEKGWVIMRGPRSEDELLVLLARLFPQ